MVLLRQEPILQTLQGFARGAHSAHISLRDQEEPRWQQKTAEFPQWCHTGQNSLISFILRQSFKLLSFSWPDVLGRREMEEGGLEWGAPPQQD